MAFKIASTVSAMVRFRGFILFFPPHSSLQQPPLISASMTTRPGRRARVGRFAASALAHIGTATAARQTGQAGVLASHGSTQAAWNACAQAGIARHRSPARAASRHTTHEGEAAAVSSPESPRVEGKAKLGRRRMSTGESPARRGGGGEGARSSDVMRWWRRKARAARTRTRRSKADAAAKTRKTASVAAITAACTESDRRRAPALWRGPPPARPCLASLPCPGASSGMAAPAGAGVAIWMDEAIVVLGWNGIFCGDRWREDGNWNLERQGLRSADPPQSRYFGRVRYVGGFAVPVSSTPVKDLFIII